MIEYLEDSNKVLTNSGKGDGRQSSLKLYDGTPYTLLGPR